MNLKEIKNKSLASRSKSLSKRSNSNSKPSTNNKQKTKKPKQSSDYKTISYKNSKSKEKKISQSTSKSKPHETLKTTSSPIQTSKNLDTLEKLIKTSQSILSEQNSLADKFSEITKRISSSDYEIERLSNKNRNENEEFGKFFDKYGNNLNQIANRLKIHTDEVEDLKCIYTNYI